MKKGYLIFFQVLKMLDCELQRQKGKSKTKHEKFKSVALTATANIKHILDSSPININLVKA